MSEAILALIEHATVQRKNLPTDQWENCWLPYSRERWKKSTELRRFFSPNRNWYTNDLASVIGSFDLD